MQRKYVTSYEFIVYNIMLVIKLVMREVMTVFDGFSTLERSTSQLKEIN
jgi:hypothetical protein